MPDNSIPYGFIYKTYLPDGRFYIGQHKIISHNTLDPTYFGSGVVIRDYIRSKGKSSLTREILAFGHSFDEMNLLEAQFITTDVLADHNCVNLDYGGRNKYSRYEEVRSRIGKSVSARRRENPEKWPSKKGKDNNKSVNWKLVSPQGEEFIICGGLHDFCANKGLSVNTITAAINGGWIPRRGKCSGWKAFNLDTNAGTIRDTQNHGESWKGTNNPYTKSRLRSLENES